MAYLIKVLPTFRRWSVLKRWMWYPSPKLGEGYHIQRSTKQVLLSFNESALLKDMTHIIAHADIIANSLKGEY